MGIFCMIFGVIVFLGFTGGGIVLANSLVSAQMSFYAGPIISFFGLPTDPLPYIVVFGFIGFLLGLSFFMKGLICYRLEKLNKQ